MPGNIKAIQEAILTQNEEKFRDELQKFTKEELEAYHQFPASENVEIDFKKIRGYSYKLHEKSFTLLYLAVRWGSDQMVETLLNYQVKLQLEQSNEFLTAVLYGSIKKIEYFIQRELHKSYINLPTTSGKPPLLMVIQDGVRSAEEKVAICTLLRVNGADIFQTDSDPNSPYHYSMIEYAFANNIHIARSFLEGNAQHLKIFSKAALMQGSVSGIEFIIKAGGYKYLKDIDMRGWLTRSDNMPEKIKELLCKIADNLVNEKLSQIKEDTSLQQQGEILRAAQEILNEFSPVVDLYSFQIIQKNVDNKTKENKIKQFIEAKNMQELLSYIDIDCKGEIPSGIAYELAQALMWSFNSAVKFKNNYRDLLYKYILQSLCYHDNNTYLMSFKAALHYAKQAKDGKGFTNFEEDTLSCAINVKTLKGVLGTIVKDHPASSYQAKFLTELIEHLHLPEVALHALKVDAVCKALGVTDNTRVELVENLITFLPQEPTPVTQETIELNGVKEEKEGRTLQKVINLGKFNAIVKEDLTLKEKVDQISSIGEPFVHPEQFKAFIQDNKHNPMELFYAFYEIKVEGFNKTTTLRKGLEKLKDHYNLLIQTEIAVAKIHALFIDKMVDDRWKYAKELFKKLIIGVTKQRDIQAITTNDVAEINTMIRSDAQGTKANLQNPGFLQTGDNHFIKAIKELSSIQTSDLRRIFTQYSQYIDKRLTSEDLTEHEAKVIEDLTERKPAPEHPLKAKKDSGFADVGSHLSGIFRFGKNSASHK